MKMELFRYVRKCYQTLGVYPVQSNQNSRFNLRNLFILMCILQMFTSSLAYFLFEAKLIGEFADSFFMVSSTLNCAFYFLISIFKISNILTLIGEFEQFIEKSKFKTLSRKMSQKLNKFPIFELRIDEFNFEGDVCRTNRENRTNGKATLFLYG